MEVDNISPWTPKNIYDYDKLMNTFGTNIIDDELIKRFEKITNKPAHYFLKRGIFFSHQDLDKILDEIESNKQIYIYTGRGPSSKSMHLGHLVPFIFTKYLQDALNAIVIIQLSDDEKYFFSKDNKLKLDDYNKLCRENAKDIIACGFDVNKTFIFSNLECMSGSLYRNNTIIMKNITGNIINSIYGLDLSSNIGKLVWPCFQSGPAFSTSFPEIFGENQYIV